MKINLFLLLVLASFLLAGCGKNVAAPPAAAPAPVAESDHPEFDEAPGLDEEGSREW
jgi:outer membrane biogenesis lipoprotein LolB